MTPPVLRPPAPASTSPPVLALTVLILLVAGTLAVGSPACADDGWLSADGRYRLAIDSAVEPLPLNRIHRWTLRLTDTAGEPVEGAMIEVTGGMPRHDHGLPTDPRVTRELGGGLYLLEGIRFHMRGLWELRFDVSAADGADTVLVSLDV